MNQIFVYKGRTSKISVGLGYDVSTDTLESEIRVDKDRESELIATWSITFLTDGIDGELIFTLDDSVTDDVDKSQGFMDLKRITGGEPVNVWDEPIEVLFREPVTA